MPALVPTNGKSSRVITWHYPALPPIDSWSGWPPGLKPMVRNANSHDVFSTAAEMVPYIVSLATTPQRHHDDVTSSEGVRCSAGEFPVCRAPHLLATCHDNFTAQRREYRAKTIQTKHQRSCTPAPSTWRVDAAGILLAARAFVFGLFLFFILHHLLCLAHQFIFHFTPASQLLLILVRGDCAQWMLR